MKSFTCGFSSLSKMKKNASEMVNTLLKNREERPKYALYEFCKSYKGCKVLLVDKLSP